jgi:hypothetical protein
MWGERRSTRRRRRRRKKKRRGYSAAECGDGGGCVSGGITEGEKSGGEAPLKDVKMFQFISRNCLVL